MSSGGFAGRLFHSCSGEAGSVGFCWRNYSFVLDLGMIKFLRFLWISFVTKMQTILDEKVVCKNAHLNLTCVKLNVKLLLNFRRKVLLWAGHI